MKRLTVQSGKANSHAKCGWQTFTDAVIQYEFCSFFSRRNFAQIFSNFLVSFFRSVIFDVPLCRLINKELSGVVFILWGLFAQKKGKGIDRSPSFVGFSLLPALLLRLTSVCSFLQDEAPCHRVCAPVANGNHLPSLPSSLPPFSSSHPVFFSSTHSPTAAGRATRASARRTRTWSASARSPLIGRSLLDEIIMCDRFVAFDMHLFASKMLFRTSATARRVTGISACSRAV